MLSQVSFTTDTELKKRTLERAKSKGLTLKAVLVFAMEGFANGELQFAMKSSHIEPEVEELTFDDKNVKEKASKLARLLK